MVVSEIGSPPDTAYSQSVPPLEPVSLRPSPFFVRRRRLWDFVLKRDEAHRLYSSFALEVVQLKARLEGLQAALSITEEATTARV